MTESRCGSAAIVVLRASPSRTVVALCRGERIVLRSDSRWAYTRPVMTGCGVAELARHLHQPDAARGAMLAAVCRRRLGVVGATPAAGAGIPARLAARSRMRRHVV